ncbi:MAG: hypothetical protein H8E44_33610 [Planctomycetes bacterium]|nr:hypothetical protein [Planctomycetota bacterium]MBL7042563.1 hypothetical protein [Pirellulaceae bacterium]
MGKRDEHLSETRPQTGGVARDFNRLKSDGAATVSELREFLGQMHGRSPQEVIGMVAKSGLTRSIILATFLFVILLVACTIIPYVWKDRDGSTAGPAAGQTDTAKAPAAKPDESKPDEQPAEAVATTAKDKSVSDELDPDRAIDAMGIGETRTADPDKNPMEDKLDKLLDGIE